MSERKVTMQGNPLALGGEPLQIGQPAPAFTALKADLTPYSPAEDKGKVLIINSVPSLDTPVCQTQTRRFNEAAASLGPNSKVLVVSMDLPFAQGRFCSTAGIENLQTLSDHRDAAFGNAYGMIIPALRLLARGVTVVDQKGVVRYHETVPEIGQEPNYEAALAAAKTLL